MQTILETTASPRFIVGIFPDGEEEAQCIRIAHPSRMYLTDDYIPTHNSWEPESESLERAATMPRQVFTFDQARKEAKKFQGRPLTNDNTRMVAHVSRDSLDKMLSGKSSDKSSSAAIHALAVANLDHLFKNAVPGWSKTDRDRDPNISALHRMFAPMRVGDDTKLVKLTVKEFTIPDQENKLYTVEAVDVEDGVSPVPEMVDADRTRGSRLLTGPTGLAESLVESIQKRNRENRSMESPLRRERAADQAAPASVDRQWAQELSALGQTMRRTRGSDQVKAVREQIVGKPLTNLETGIVATVSGESWRKMMSASNVDLSISPQAHMQALGNIDTLFRLATLEETRSGKKSVDAGTIIAIRHFVIPMPFDGDVLQVRIMAKEFSDVNQGNRLYLIEAVEIEGEATPASLIGAAVEGGSTSSRGGYPPRPAGVVDRFAQMVTLVKGENVSDDDLLYQQATPTPPAPPNPPTPWQKSKDKVSSLVSPRAIDALISTWQDKYVDLKRVREHIQKTDGALSDMNDAYTGENLSHQRIAKRHKDFLKDELEPLFKEMRQYGIAREALEQFLHARHAPEANRVMARRNPNEEQIKAGQEAAEAKLKELRIQLQHAQARNSATRAIEQAIEKAQAEVTHWKTAEAFRGTEKERLSLSGMSDADAKALMDALSPDKRKKMESLAERIDAINAKTLTLLDSYGLMDSSSLDAWRSTYQYYVPLHRDEAHPEGFSHPIGSGFNVRGPAAKQRTGSNEKVTNILGHIAMQREAAITRGEKNRVDKMLFLLASQNPNPDFWTVNQPKRKKILENGLVRVRVDPNYRNQPNVLMLRIAGKEAYVTFNEHNPEAMRLAAALKNLDVSDMGVVTGLMFKLTRYFASINTQYNPLFGLRNFGRDTLFGLPALSSTELAGQQKQLFKETMRLLKEAFKAGFDLDSMDGKEKAFFLCLCPRRRRGQGRVAFDHRFQRPRPAWKSPRSLFPRLCRPGTVSPTWGFVAWIMNGFRGFR